MSISQASGMMEFLAGETALTPPRWAREIFPDAVVSTARVEDAVKLDSNTFEQRTTAAYAQIREQIAPLHPVRFWNHIPAIHAVMDSRRDRYMVFNAGRFKAFESWYGSSQEFSRQVATASGVGHSGSDLVIHCLATAMPGIAVENPRQISSYRYSRRYGPLPPCFARATICETSRRKLLLVGGTASIRGEDSMYVDSLGMQLDETFDNLASLITAAQSRHADPLSRYRFLRVYYPMQRDRARILDAVGSAMPGLTRMELIQAELCRAELLVEIEGVAEL